MSVARFIADQRTKYRVPHTVVCVLLGVSLAWFYKWIVRTPTPSERRRPGVDAAVVTAFTKARGLHGSPCGSPENASDTSARPRPSAWPGADEHHRVRRP